MEQPLINEFVDRRIWSCRHCHGNGTRQLTPGEYDEAKARHNIKRAEKIATGKGDIGEFPPYEGEWYDRRKAPNPDCPKCHGEGFKKTLLRDTRTLSPRGKAAFAGVKIVEGRAVVMFRENGVTHEVTGA